MQLFLGDQLDALRLGLARGLAARPGPCRLHDRATDWLAGLEEVSVADPGWCSGRDDVVIISYLLAPSSLPSGDGLGFQGRWTSEAEYRGGTPGTCLVLSSAKKLILDLVRTLCIESSLLREGLSCLDSFVGSNVRSYRRTFLHRNFYMLPLPMTNDHRDVSGLFAFVLGLAFNGTIVVDSVVTDTRDDLVRISSL